MSSARKGHRVARYAAPREKPPAREIVRRIVFVLSILVFVGSAVYLVDYYGTRYLARQEAVGVRQEARTYGVAAPSEEPYDFGEFEPLTREGLEALTATNPDFVGWINIPNTNIDYPVVAGVDNVKYLDTTFEGNRRSAGTIFLEKSATLDFESQNSILYGHNMRDKSMFQNLVSLRSADTRDGIETVYLQKPDGTVNVYRIFTAFACEPDYDYRRPEYAEEDFAAFKERLMARNEIPTDVDISFEDRLLGLSTCVYDFADARYVVHAVLVDQVPTE